MGRRMEWFTDWGVSAIESVVNDVMLPFLITNNSGISFNREGDERGKRLSRI